MYVEKLTRDQVDEFVRKHMIEADFHPELPNNKRQIDFARYMHKPAAEVHYCSKLFNRHISAYLMDDRMIPLVSKELENAWIRYLYGIFGEEYKEWYMSEQEKLFD